MRSKLKDEKRRETFKSFENLLASSRGHKVRGARQVVCCRDGRKKESQKKKEKNKNKAKISRRGEEAQTGQAKKKRNGERNGTSAHLSAGGFPGPHTSLGKKYQWKFHLNGTNLNFDFVKLKNRKIVKMEEGIESTLQNL